MNKLITYFTKGQEEPEPLAQGSQTSSSLFGRFLFRPYRFKIDGVFPGNSHEVVEFE